VVERREGPLVAHLRPGPVGIEPFHGRIEVDFAGIGKGSDAAADGRAAGIKAQQGRVKEKPDQAHGEPVMIGVWWRTRKEPNVTNPSRKADAKRAPSFQPKPSHETISWRKKDPRRSGGIGQKVIRVKADSSTSLGTTEVGDTLFLTLSREKTSFPLTTQHDFVLNNYDGNWRLVP
jgi:hypothetical protein